MEVSIQRFSFDISIMCRYIAIFIDATILLTCLNFDIDIELTTVYIKLLKCQYIFGILHITSYDTKKPFRLPLALV